MKSLKIMSAIYLTIVVFFFFTTTLTAQNKDSVVSISVKQIRKANAVFVNYQESKTLLDSIGQQVKSYEVLHQKQSELIVNQAKQISYQQKIADDKDAIINGYEKELATIGRKTKWLKTQRAILFISTLSFAGLYLHK